MVLVHGASIVHLSVLLCSSMVTYFIMIRLYDSISCVITKGLILRRNIYIALPAIKLTSIYCSQIVVKT
jgi:hypothetical protein